MRSLAQTRHYDRHDSVVFRKTKEEFGGLSNMAAGFPLRVNGITILTSEALYQACRFPHLPDIQRLVISQKSPMTAKMKSKRYRSQSRKDWDVVRVPVMRWCLRVKLATNWTKFRDLLLATRDRPIVEESRKDDFWGAKVRNDGLLVGANALGRLLMELREEARDPSCEVLRRVEPLRFRDFLLNGKPIRVIEAIHTREDAQDLLAPKARRSLPAQTSARLGTPSRFEPTVGSSEITINTPADSVQEHTGSAKPYPRRLIEADLPIRRISDHARPEKTTVHGNISTLHKWWARRPHAACRAVACASLWFDPAEDRCPVAFRATARRLMEEWAKDQLTLCGEESLGRFVAIANTPSLLDDNLVLRQALLDFIADFSQWRHQATPAYLEVARALTAKAHEAAGANAGSRPFVFDPFAGGGTIPLECMRIGADVFASDLNPLAVLLNAAVIEFIPRWGTQLSARVSELGKRVRRQADAQLNSLYPAAPDGGVPLVYLWARTVHCEGPNCGYQIPLVRTLDLGRGQHLALEAVSSDKTFHVSVVRDGGQSATVKGGSVACPRASCGYTTPAKAVRAQLFAKAGGTKDAQLLAVLVEKDGRRQFRTPNRRDVSAATAAKVLNPASLPEAKINPIRPHKDTRGVSAVTRIGMTRFDDLYSHRQLRAIEAFSDILEERMGRHGNTLDHAALTILGLCFGRLLQQNSSCARWRNKAYAVAGSFGKHALQVVWDFAEVTPLSDAAGSWNSAVQWALKVIDLNATIHGTGTAVHAAAQECPLPADSASLLFTDPPYFAAIPYTDLSDFFYVWQRRVFAHLYPDLFDRQTVDQEREVIVTDANLGPGGIRKDEHFFRTEMTMALKRAREIVAPNGLGIVVFADSRTESWEALLGAVIESGWTITASWPIDTEHQSRTQAQGTASLQSSIHIVCRPRLAAEGKELDDVVGDWRAVLMELPKKLSKWMPRLAQEGVVGADAIFACLGPALEVFSRYSRVERVSGERVELREYLEQVWAAVAHEALSMVFEDADATGLEADARLTAMWLWTLSTTAKTDNETTTLDDANEDNSLRKKQDESSAKPRLRTTFSLEFDAARKIAQGLGAHLEDVRRVVEIKGDRARLLSVAERTRHLFGQDDIRPPPARRTRVVRQLALFEELEAAEQDAGWGSVGLPPLGVTTLDRVHQAMVLFAAGRGEALKRFLVEEGVGHVSTFWKLAQSLSALYPSGTDEKRWIDAVLARKKGLGF